MLLCFRVQVMHSAASLGVQGMHSCLGVCRCLSVSQLRVYLVFAQCQCSRMSACRSLPLHCRPQERATGIATASSAETARAMFAVPTQHRSVVVCGDCIVRALRRAELCIARPFTEGSSIIKRSVGGRPMQGARHFSLGFAWRRFLSQTRVPDMAAFGVDHLPQHRQARVPAI